FEVESNSFDTFLFTVTYFSGPTMLGSISRMVTGAAGARLMAVDSSGLGITRVVVTAPPETIGFSIAQIRYELGGRAFISGRVTEGGSGTPIAGATITAAGPVTRSGTSDAMGNYSVRVQTGLYTLTASAFGFLTKTHMGVLAEDDTTTTFDIFLARASTR